MPDYSQFASQLKKFSTVANRPPQMGKLGQAMGQMGGIQPRSDIRQLQGAMKRRLTGQGGNSMFNPGQKPYPGLQVGRKRHSNKLGKAIRQPGMTTGDGPGSKVNPY